MDLHTQRIGNRRNIAVGIDSEIVPKPLVLPLIQRRRSKSLYCLRNQCIPCKNKIKRLVGWPIDCPCQHISWNVLLLNI